MIQTTKLDLFAGIPVADSPAALLRHRDAEASVPIDGARMVPTRWPISSSLEPRGVA
jgi:hypothetical protein